MLAVPLHESAHHGAPRVSPQVYSSWLPSLDGNARRSSRELAMRSERRFALSRPFSALDAGGGGIDDVGGGGGGDIDDVGDYIVLGGGLFSLRLLVLVLLGEDGKRPRTGAETDDEDEHHQRE